MRKVSSAIAYVFANGAIVVLLIAAGALFGVAMMRGHVMTWQAITLLGIGIFCVLTAFGMLKGGQIEAFGVKINLSLQDQLEQIKAQNLILTSYMDTTKPLLRDMAVKINQIEQKIETDRVVIERTAKTEFVPPPKDRPYGRFKDDHQKYRWGKDAERAGFALSASFRDLEREDWVRVDLEVRSIEDGKELIGPVTFFLHPTFPQEQVQVESENGVAQLSVTCRGGFTVGAWIHNGGIQLELDLAELDEAPRIIRDL